MFESLSQGIKSALSFFQGRRHLTEENIREGMREVRKALLEADVNFKVVKDFIDRVTEKSVGQDVIQGVNPGQQIVKIVYDELVGLMGPVETRIQFDSNKPTVIMMVGLQGSGKTTTTGKLALRLRKAGRTPLLVAADVQRPAAIEQLRTLGKELNLPVYSEAAGRPAKICQRGVEQAERMGQDVVLLDTAGRLHVDQLLMEELKDISQKVKPHETLLVVDAMTGQDAVNSSKEFHEKLPLSGVILTKMDGDARGGAALSIKSVTGKPIKFIGVGEKLDRLEEFHADRIASRILGMGDVVSFVEKAQEAIDQEEAQQRAEKFLTNTFTLDDFLGQLQALKKMGPVQELMKMLPGMEQMMPPGQEVDEKEFHRMEAIIQSMTREERVRPEVVDHSRRQRIARGSGTRPHDVNNLVKQYREMRKMMKDVGRMGGFFGKVAGVKMKKHKIEELRRLKQRGVDITRFVKPGDAGGAG